MTIGEHYAFRVTRNADLSVGQDEAGDLLAAVELELQRRRFGEAVRLEIAADATPAIRDLLVAEVDVPPESVYAMDGPIDLSGLWAVAGLDRPDLSVDPWLPITAPPLAPPMGTPISLALPVGAPSVAGAPLGIPPLATGPLAAAQVTAAPLAAAQVRKVGGAPLVAAPVTPATPVTPVTPAPASAQEPAQRSASAQEQPERSVSTQTTAQQTTSAPAQRPVSASTTAQRGSTVIPTSSLCSGTRTSWYITPTTRLPPRSRRSSGRRRTTPTCSPSSRRCTEPRGTARSWQRSSELPSWASRWRPWWRSRPGSTSRPTLPGPGRWRRRACTSSTAWPA